MRFTAAGLPDLTFGTGEHEAVAIALIAAGSMASAVRVSGANLVVAGVALSNGNIDRARRASMAPDTSTRRSGMRGRWL